eukprot:5578101-Pyramimonas_sp.AAC.5
MQVTVTMSSATSLTLKSLKGYASPTPTGKKNCQPSRNEASHSRRCSHNDMQRNAEIYRSVECSNVVCKP